jgi:hypothetical protein
VTPEKKYTAVRCLQPKGWNRGLYVERVPETSDGIVPERLPSATTQNLVIATLTEGGNTYSKRALAPDEIDDDVVDTFAPFLPDPTPAEKRPYLLDAITIE